MRIPTIVFIIETLLMTQILVGCIIIIILPSIRQLLLPYVHLLPPQPIFG
jgi:hypothetical protein